MSNLKEINRALIDAEEEILAILGRLSHEHGIHTEDILVQSHEITKFKDSSRKWKHVKATIITDIDWRDTINRED